MHVKRMRDRVVIIDDGEDRTLLEFEDGRVVELRSLDKLVRDLWRLLKERYSVQSQEST